MSTVRLLSPPELPVCLEAGRMFFEEGKLPGGFKPECFIRNWTGLIESGSGAVLGMFGPDGGFMGALGAVLGPDPNNDDLLAIEAFWYVLPQFRGNGVKLLLSFERWAKSRGAVRLAMIHLHHLQPERLSQLYQRLGYRLIESNYSKDVK